MIDAGIHDNDVVVVDRDTRPVEGHIVIAIVDGGFVCRQLCRRRGDLLLEARNAQQIYEPTPVEGVERSEEHTSELQSLMRISYAVFCLKKNTRHTQRYK